MINLLFEFGPEIIMVKIEGNSITFQKNGSGFVPINSLKLSQAGVEKEFPDLVGDDNWKKEAINRFREHIKTLRTDRSKADYVIEDLKKHGYMIKREQIAGQRWMKK